MSEFTEIECSECGQGWTPTYFGDEDGVATHDCDPHKFMDYQCEIIDSADRKLILQIRDTLEIARRKYKDDMAAAYQVHGDAVRKLQAEYQEMTGGDND